MGDTTDTLTIVLHCFLCQKMLKLTLVVAVASCVLFCVDTGKGVAAQNWEDTYTFYSRDGSSSVSAITVLCHGL